VSAKSSFEVRDLHVLGLRQDAPVPARNRTAMAATSRVMASCNCSDVEQFRVYE